VVGEEFSSYVDPSDGVFLVMVVGGGWWWFVVVGWLVGE